MCGCVCHDSSSAGSGARVGQDSLLRHFLAVCVTKSPHPQFPLSNVSFPVLLHFAMAIETNYHGLDRRTCITGLTVLEGRSLPIKALAGCVSSGGRGKNAFSPLFQLL